MNQGSIIGKSFTRLFAFMFVLGIIFNICCMPLKAEEQYNAVSVSAPSAVLMESSTGQIIYEKEPNLRRTPASVTKVMTLLLTFEALEKEQVHLEDVVVTSEYAASMGGSQVYLEEGEEQTLETLIKCITVCSGNDASVAVAEHVAGSEEAFVAMMNERAIELGMLDTHFVDCCGLTDSEEHYSCARDIAVMARELTVKHPEIFNYSTIWMENITHKTRRGETEFTLSSTNKLLKQYPYCNGLKTGFTRRAGYCLAATGTKEDVSLIAVVMGGNTSRERNKDCVNLLSYGFSKCKVYRDDPSDILPKVTVRGGKEKLVTVSTNQDFTYLDLHNIDLTEVKRSLSLPETVSAPVEKGTEAGCVRYLSGDDKTLGELPLYYAETVEKASFLDSLGDCLEYYLLQIL